jgi:hypothetical protein
MMMMIIIITIINIVFASFVCMCTFFFSSRARFVIGLWPVKFARK